MKRCAIILAAGRGSRMGELTINTPKGLIGPPGETSIERQLKNLRKVDLEEIRIVTGYLGSHFDKLGTQTIHNGEWENSNMVYSLITAFEWAQSFEQVLVSYADIFFPIDALEKIMNQNNDIAILYDVNWLKTWTERFSDPLSDAETFKVDSTGNLLEIGQKPISITEIEGQYMGLLSFSKHGWKIFFDFIFGLPLFKQMSIDMTSALNLFLRKEESPVKCIPFSGLWGEIDSKSDLEIYMSKITEKETLR